MPKRLKIEGTDYEFKVKDCSECLILDFCKELQYKDKFDGTIHPNCKLNDWKE